MKTRYPEKIYIQIEDESGNKFTAEEIEYATWHSKRIYDSDLVYVKERKCRKKLN